MSSASMDWKALSPTGLWTLRQIAVRIYLGYSEREIGKLLGIPTRTVKEHMAVLRSEIEGQYRKTKHG